MQEEMNKDTRGIIDYYAVDLAKFICAVMVVALHVAPFGSNGSRICVFFNFVIQQWFARIAVPFFFTASGFFLYRKSKDDVFSIEATKKYVLKLLKLYIIWTLIYFPFRIENIVYNRSGVAAGVLVYIRDIIFDGSYIHLWYFPATIFAVILISFLMSKKVGIKTILIVAVFFYALGLSAQSWFGIIAPLRTLTPSLWTLLELIKKVIVTTRDGLFEGFLFVGIGGMIAYKGFRVTRKKALTAFVLSYMLMLFEAVFVTYFSMSRAHDMYIFLVPLTYFAFGLAVNIHLPDKEIYNTLRILSSLIFYIHPLVIWFIQKIFDLWGIDIGRTCLLFILTIVFSIICSLMIIKLSDIKHFCWLKKIYS